MSDLIECVPNFSEGRDRKILAALRNATESIPNVFLLDVHSDSWHNRSVFTLVGPPMEIENVVLQMAGEATQRIDLRSHRGAHPRTGATDVVPCVPLESNQMNMCVAVAERIARRIGDELGVPVFLYGDAATSEERRHLPHIRRHGLEDLGARMQADPAWHPDFGPADIHPTAGITIVGARRALIAYNIYLADDDVSVAQNIARSIRTSSGGLPGVRALGFLVDGRAQVSMNLVEPEVTNPATVFDAVQRKARELGVEIGHSEFVGLVPQEFVPADPQRTIQLQGNVNERVLELRIQKSTQMKADKR